MTKVKSNFLQQKPLIIIIIYTMRRQYCSVRDSKRRRRRQLSTTFGRWSCAMLGTRTSTPSGPRKLLTFHGSAVRGNGSRRGRDGLPRRKSRRVMLCVSVRSVVSLNFSSGRRQFRERQFSRLRSLNVFGHCHRHNSLVFSTCTSSSHTSRYRRQPSRRGRGS